VIVSVGSGVKVKVAGNVSVEGMLVVELPVAVGEERVGCPELAAEQETVSNRKISSSTCPFFIPAFYYCFMDAIFTSLGI
jgi:hypothetical protein